MDKKILKNMALAGFCGVVASACAHGGGTQMGAAVRHMTEQQIQNLDAAYNPDPTPVTGGDVYRLDDVLDAHRNNHEDPTEDYGALLITPD